jgi:protein-S-isoprenylcysteine O-methyltransferase Ste14
MRPGGTAALTNVSDIVQIAGLLMAALLSLRRSFAVVPANRGVRVGRLYRLVRHPLYISELIIFLGIVLGRPTISNIVIWACECGLRFARACAEERFLASDPAYIDYRERVRYRLIPGLV